MTFDEQLVHLDVEPPGRAPWSDTFNWSAIVRIVFKAEGVHASDGIYVFTGDRPESYAIPLEADGGRALWAEILRRGLFDPDLALRAASAAEGLFVWPKD